MSRFTKIILWLIAALAALFAVAAIAFSLFFDPNDFREDISRAVKESTGRELTIDGEVSLQLFPWLAVEIGHTTLGNAPGFGDEPFAEFDRAQLSVRLFPLLLRQELAVGTAELDALRLNFEVNKSGLQNWSDLVTAEESPESAEGTSGDASIDISGVDIRDASIRYVDRQTGDSYSLTEVNFGIGRVSTSGDAVPARGSLRFDFQPMAYSGEMSIDTTVAFDLDAGTVTFGNTSLEGLVEGLTSSTTSLDFETPGIEVQMDEQIAAIQPITVAVLGIDIEAQLEPFSYAGSIEPVGKIQVAEFSPRSLMHLFDVEAPETADPVVLSRLMVGADVKVGEAAIQLTNVNIRFDDTTFTGSLAVPRSATGGYRVDLVGDAIDLNRYMEPATETAGSGAADAASTELPTDLIKPLNARGSLKMTSVVLGDLELEQVSLTLNAANGRLRIHPITAGLYGGSYSGDVRIDVAGPESVLAFDEKVQGVDLAALARAMFEQENISGSLNGNFTLTGRGNDLDKIQRSLAGSMSFELKDGTYEGVDVWYELRRARALLKEETPPEPRLPARTKFSSVTATGVVTAGVMRNDDFVADLPFMQLTGKGNVDIPNGTVDYNLRARVYKKPEALEGATQEEIDDFTKTVIPLKISGPLTSPKVRPDVEELLRQRVEEEIEDKLKDKLKDLFN
jgi:AsmA protein